MWFRALFSFVIFFFLQCFTLNSFGTGSLSQHQGPGLSPLAGRWLLGDLCPGQAGAWVLFAMKVPGRACPSIAAWPSMAPPWPLPPACTARPVP